MSETGSSSANIDFRRCMFRPSTNKQYQADVAQFDGRLDPFFIIGNGIAHVNSIFILHVLDEAVELYFYINYNSMLSSGTTTTK